MRLIRYAAVPALLAAAACAADPVLLGTRRDGWIEAFRLDTLETEARIRVRELVEGVESGPDAQWLFVLAPHPQAPEVCCALFALDVHRLRAFAILWPGIRPAIANGKLYVQRGDEGIEIFDARSLAHLPTLRAPGMYQLAPSPDGRWLFGTRQFPSPGLDIFDLSQQKMVRQIPVEGAQPLRGVWLGAQFYLFAPGLPGAGRFWSVDPQTGTLGSPKLIRLGNVGTCGDTDYQLVPAGDRIAIYTPAGTKIDRTACSPGGYMLTDPATGAVSARLAPNQRFSHLIPAADSKSLFGLNLADSQLRGPQLVKLDAASGKILAEKALPPDAWTISLGSIPSDWQGRLDLQGVFQ
jgi:hypothetical protein